MPAAAPTVEELFDTEFLTALQGFSLWVRRVLRGGRHADQLSIEKGAGLEFADYKPYVAGDDTRAIDWNIYQRLGRVVVKVFEERQDLPVYLLVDRSSSMYFELEPKVGVAVKVALALASISLSQHDSVGLFSFSGEMEMKMRTTSGQGKLMRVAERLAKLDEQDTTELVGALDGLSSFRLRRGLLVVISDFYDPAGLDAVLDALRQSRHRLLLVQLVSDHDLDPASRRELRGDVRLRDCETGEAVDVSLTPAILANYRVIVEDFNDRLTGFAASRGAAFIRLNTGQDVLQQLASAFEAGDHLGMNFANLSLPLLLAGAAGLAGLLYFLQQLRIRYTEVQVPTAMFWREAARDAPVRVFRRRFRHWLAYLLSLLICWLLWLGLAEPRVDDPQGGEFHVLFLDGSAHMASGDDLQRATGRLRDDLIRLPEDRREVIWGGAFNVKLLNAGEEGLLLDRRLEGLKAEQAPSAVEEQLDLLALPGAYPETVRFVVYGRAPVSAQALARLPQSVTVQRAGDFSEAGANRGIVALGQGHAASGRWDTVDVLVRIAATGGLGTESADLLLSLDGAPLGGMVIDQAPSGDFVIRDVPAAGGVLEARLAEPDALPGDDSAQLGLAQRRILKVAVSARLGSVVADAVSADPGLTLAEDGADLVFRQAGEEFGAGLPALEFASMSEQQSAFEIQYTGDVDAELALRDSLQRLGLHLIDGAGLAAKAGREVSVQASAGEGRSVAVWGELLNERYNFTGSRAFPLFISRAARWLAEDEPAYAYLAAGRNAPEETSEFALAGPGNSVTVLLGSELAPLRAGSLQSDRGRPSYPVSLLSTEVSTAQAGVLLPSFSPSAVGISGPSLIALLLVLAALVLLAFEWFAYQRGLMP